MWGSASDRMRALSNGETSMSRKPVLPGAGALRARPCSSGRKPRTKVPEFATNVGTTTRAQRWNRRINNAQWVMRSGFETMARIGYAARGIVYFIVGTFATLAAFGGQQPVGTKGALEKLLSNPFGGVLLVILAAGLICFAVWRLAQALLDADRHGRSGKALALRTIYPGNGLFYFGLAVWSVSLMLTLRSGADDDQATHDWTAWLLGQPFGRWLVIAVGAGIAATGIAVAIKGLGGHFER